MLVGRRHEGRGNLFRSLAKASGPFSGMKKRPAVPRSMKAWALWINYPSDPQHPGHFYPYCDPMPKLFKTEAEARAKSMGPHYGVVVAVKISRK